LSANGYSRFAIHPEDRIGQTNAVLTGPSLLFPPSMPRSVLNDDVMRLKVNRTCKPEPTLRMGVNQYQYGPFHNEFSLIRFQRTLCWNPSWL